MRALRLGCRQKASESAASFDFLDVDAKRAQAIQLLVYG